MAQHVHANVSWLSGLKFVARPDSGHELVIDSIGGKGHEGPSPMELILIGVAGCTAMDVVHVLGKMRTPPTALDVEISGARAQTDPKYFNSLTITYRVKGPSLEREKVERAVQLSHETFCSALATIRPDCKVTRTIEIGQG